MLQELTGMVRTRTVSARELVERALTRVERHNGALNAVVALRAEEALAEADAVDAAIARGERLGPLAGVPLLAKEVHDVRGMPTTQASLVFADAAPATRDCLHIARLRHAGTIVVGKTNIPEFCFEGFTANLLYGVTRNPWAPDLSPGGSSGGSAAAMAAGMVPVATAGDGGGSIRIPAAFCGLAGIKPTHALDRPRRSAVVDGLHDRRAVGGEHRRPAPAALGRGRAGGRGPRRASRPGPWTSPRGRRCRGASSRRRASPTGDPCRPSSPTCSPTPCRRSRPISASPSSRSNPARSFAPATSTPTGPSRRRPSRRTSSAGSGSRPTPTASIPPSSGR